MAPRRQVKLMSDYEADWPLWDNGMISPEDLGLSPALAAHLRAWQELFDIEFHWDTGWGTKEAEERYARDAATLLYRLRDEVGPHVEVELNAWPVTDRRLRTWLNRRQQAT